MPRLVIECIDQIAAAIIRFAAEAHLIWVALGELQATPTLREPFTSFLLPNLSAESQGHIFRDGLFGIAIHLCAALDKIFSSKIYLYVSVSE